MIKSKFLNKLLPSIIISLIIVSIISIITFWYILRGTLYTSAEEDFFEHGQIYALIVEEHMDKLASTSHQISSRSQMRIMLQEYADGSKSLASATKYIQPRLADAVLASNDIRSAVWMDLNGTVIAAVGTTEQNYHTNEIRTYLDTSNVHYKAPIYLNDTKHVRVTTKILSGSNELIGYNLVYYPLTNLEHILSRRVADKDDLKLISVGKHHEDIFDFNKAYNSGINIDATLSEVDLGNLTLNGENILTGDFAVALVPVAGTQWHIINVHTLDDLYAPILRLLYRAFILIMVMVAISISAAWRIVTASMQEIERYQRELISSNDQLSASLKELKKMQDQMVRRETLAALGELVGGLMHELSTPIGTAITSLSYLDTEVKSLTSETEADTSVYDEAYNITFSNLERAITNIDTFRIINMDQATLEMRRIKVDDYMKEIILSLKPKLKKTSHHIDLKCDPQLFAVTTPGILSQIMTNLILNSLKHGFEGIQSGHITIDISKSGQTLTIIYSDDGVGIPDNHLTHVFEPYFTTKRDEGGTGLGLHIIYTLVTKQLKGNIDIESTIHVGTTFTIQFPVG